MKQLRLAGPSELLGRSELLRPLAVPLFGALWLAALLANIGSWMETVGAQWWLVSQPDSSAFVALVQTAEMLPMMLLALPAGVLADVLDRRRLLIATQVFLVVVAVLLAVATATDRLTPGLLLVLTFVLGAGGAVTVPAWEALIPDVVRRADIRSAAMLGSVNVNVARAIGPAIAGVLVAVVGIAPVFGLNAVTYLVFAVVLIWARIPRPESTMRRERFLPAMRTGGAFVRWTPDVTTILFRSALFLLPAVTMWALLPLVASDVFGLGAAGYGTLLGALGVGAIVGIVLLGTIRQRLSDEHLMRVASLVYAAAMVLLVTIPSTLAAIVVLLLSGACWVGFLSNANALLQLALPAWVRARALALFMVVLFGTQAIGAFIWGLVAAGIGLRETFVLAGAITVAGVAIGWRWKLPDVSTIDRSAALYWGEANLAFEPDLDVGPVLVEVNYSIPADRETEFLAAMEHMERSRRATGARTWRLVRDGNDLSRFIEVFELGSWDEHLRQHIGGLTTEADRAVEQRVQAFSTQAPFARHYFPADVPTSAPTEEDPPVQP